MNDDKTQCIDIIDSGVCEILVDEVPVQSGGRFQLTGFVSQIEGEADYKMFPTSRFTMEITSITGNAQLTSWRPHKGEEFELIGEAVDKTDGNDWIIWASECKVKQVNEDGILFSCQSCSFMDPYRFEARWAEFQQGKSALGA